MVVHEAKAALYVCIYIYTYIDCVNMLANFVLRDRCFTKSGEAF